MYNKADLDRLNSVFFSVIIVNLNFWIFKFYQNSNYFYLENKEKAVYTLKHL